MSEEKKDWLLDEQIVNPQYNNGYLRYDLSIKDVIEHINKSDYPIYGDNILIPDGDGGWVPLPDWVPSKPPSGDIDPDYKNYKLEIYSSNGNVIVDKRFQTILSAILYENNNIITDNIAAKHFKWTRVSGATEADQAADAQWNLKWAEGAKSIPISYEDVHKHASFTCTFVIEDTSEKMWVVNAYNTYKKLNAMEEN